MKLCQWPDAVGVEIQTVAKPIFAKIDSSGALTKSEPPSIPSLPKSPTFPGRR